VPDVVIAVIVDDLGVICCDTLALDLDVRRVVTPDDYYGTIEHPLGLALRRNLDERRRILDRAVQFVDRRLDCRFEEFVIHGLVPAVGIAVDGRVLSRMPHFSR
jgi:hypothetical protein